MNSEYLEDFTNLYTQNIATGYAHWGQSRPTIIVVRDELFSKSDPSLSTVMHEDIHLTDKDNFYIRPKIEPMINYVVDNYIKPHDPRYKEYDNKKIENWVLNLETTAEIAAIYTLLSSDLRKPVIDRKEFLEEKLYLIKQLKEKVGISKIPREDRILAYLIGYFIFEQKDKNDDIKRISENINKIVEDVLKSYIEEELKK